MRNFETVLIIQAILILILVCAVLLFVFSDNKKKTKVKKRNIYKTFPLKSLIVISLASFGVSLFINSISSDPLTSAMVFALLVSLIPYSLINAQERMKKELILIPPCRMKNSQNLFVVQKIGNGNFSMWYDHFGHKKRKTEYTEKSHVCGKYPAETWLLFFNDLCCREPYPRNSQWGEDDLYRRARHKNLSIRYIRG